MGNIVFNGIDKLSQGTPSRGKHKDYSHPNTKRERRLEEEGRENIHGDHGKHSFQ